jgi:TRAP-type C4-dicarboxylate transport system permease large subunit
MNVRYRVELSQAERAQLTTPPMGLALFLVADIAKISIKDVLRAMGPYYIPLVVTLLLITYVPSLTTWIPRLAVGN